MNREKTRGAAPSISPSGATPAFTVTCGDRHEQRYNVARYRSMGFEVNDTAAIQLILDAPRGYAFTAVASERQPGEKRIVITPNPCPEYLEDIHDLQPDALVSRELFVRHDEVATLRDVLESVSRNEQVDWRLGPRTQLAPHLRAVLQQISWNRSNEQTASNLNITIGTVKKYLARVYEELQLRDRCDLILYYWGIWTPLEDYGI